MLWGSHRRRLLRHVFQPIESLSWPASNYTACLGLLSNLSLSQREFLSRKTVFWVQLTRTLGQKWDYRSQKNKISAFRDFPKAIDFDGLGLYY